MALHEALHEALHKALREALHKALHETLHKALPKAYPLLRSSPRSAAPRPLRFPLRRYKGGCAAADFVSSAEGSIAGGGLRSTTEV